MTFLPTLYEHEDTKKEEKFPPMKVMATPGAATISSRNKKITIDTNKYTTQTTFQTAGDQYA